MKIDKKSAIVGVILAAGCGLGILVIVQVWPASAGLLRPRIVYRTVTQDGVTYKDITAAQLKQRMDDESDSGYIILDVRGKNLYDAGHIPSAINIPLNELGYRMYSLDKTKDIIVYCQTGVRCRVACMILINGGFKDIYNMVGGTQVWDYPIETSDGRVRV